MYSRTPVFPVHPELAELAQIHVLQVGNAIYNHLILYHPLLLLPLIFTSIRVLSNESVLLIRWPKNWSISFSISPSNEYSGLISFRWTGLIPLQSKGLSKISANTRVQKHRFFGIQLSLQSNSHTIHDHWKNHRLDQQTFVAKVMSLLFNMLSRLVIAFLPRNKHLVISWRQSPSAVSFGAPQIKVCPCFHCFPICFP